MLLLRKYICFSFACFLFLAPTSCLFGAKQYKHNLAAVLIFRDEAPYLKEWIEFHKLVGVQHFYLYDNLSQDNPEEVLQPYIASGVVELFKWHVDYTNFPDWNAVQCLAYNDACNRAVKDKVKWLAIIDSDEFLVPRKEDNLLSILSKYDNKKISGVRVLWVMFGTSYVDKIPEDQLMIEVLTMNEGYSQGMWKSICRPERTRCDVLIGCHTPQYQKGFHDVTLSYDEIQCNHYWTRDEYYLKTFKIPRKTRFEVTEETCLQWRDNYNKITLASEPILKFVPELKKIMNLTN